MYSSNPLPTLPLWGKFRPTVVKSCLDLSCGEFSYSGFIYSVKWDLGGAGGDARQLLGGWFVIGGSGIERLGERWGERLVDFLDGGLKNFLIGPQKP